ncbi:MAG: type II toxin-antitoxin system VapC family toxin [Pyrinomonadaceae bacterium]
MKTRQTIVFDSWPVMAYLQGEPPVDRIINILADANDRGDSLLMSVINAGEVWYSIASRRGPEAADSAIAIIRSLGIELVDIDWETTQIAARYKSKGGISYAASFAAAVAKVHSSPPAEADAAKGQSGGSVLLTGDQEFKRVENEITITWL